MTHRSGSDHGEVIRVTLLIVKGGVQHHTSSGGVQEHGGPDPLLIHQGEQYGSHIHSLDYYVSEVVAGLGGFAHFEVDRRLRESEKKNRKNREKKIDRILKIGFINKYIITNYEYNNR